MRKAIFRFTTRRFTVLVAILATMLASGITLNRLVHLARESTESAPFDMAMRNLTRVAC